MATQVSFSRLSSGSWGLRFKSGPGDAFPEPQPGQGVSVRKRDGNVKTAIVGQVVSGLGTDTVYTTIEKVARSKTPPPPPKDVEPEAADPVALVLADLAIKLGAAEDIEDVRRAGQTLAQAVLALFPEGDFS
jgi:hypothetical protein